MTIFDDGTGPALYAGGELVTPNVMRSVARFDGTSWSILGGNIGTVRTLASFDDGSGPALYAGSRNGCPCSFPSGSTNFFRWTGTDWDPVLSCPWNSAVACIAEYHDGVARRLAVAGLHFVYNVDSWYGLRSFDGNAWTTLIPNHVGEELRASLQSFDDGTGPALFAELNGAVYRIANGASVNTQAPASFGGRILAVADLGSGPELYLTCLVSIGWTGFRELRVLRWATGIWVDAGQPLTVVPHPSSSGVQSVVAFADGSGPGLVIGGAFACPSLDVANVVRWTPSGWSVAGGNLLFGHKGVNSLVRYDDGTGPAVVAAGIFYNSFAVPFGQMAVSMGGPWMPMGPPYLRLDQSGPATGAVVLASGLEAGHEYLNVFSTEPALGAIGSGAFLGLHASNVNVLVNQVFAPAGTPPFRFIATGCTQAFGSYLLPPGLVIDGVSLDVTGGVLQSVSRVRRLTVQ